MTNGNGGRKKPRINVSLREYDENRHCLMTESGNVAELVYHPQDKVWLAALISNQRLQYETMPIGNPEEHLQKLTEKLAEIRKPPEKAGPECELSLAEHIRIGREKMEAQEANKEKTSPKREEHRAGSGDECL